MASIVADDAPRSCSSSAMARKLGDVDLGVLVLAEVVLQRLQPPDERLAGRLRQQAAEALEEVAELLGVLAQVVDRGSAGVSGPIRRPSSTNLACARVMRLATTLPSARSA